MLFSVRLPFSYTHTHKPNTVNTWFVFSDFDNMEKENVEQVSGGPSPNGKWEYLRSDDKSTDDKRRDSSDKEKSFEEELTERMNTALDASINADTIKSPSRPRKTNSRRQNATLEDFMSPRRKTRPFGASKRNRTLDVICTSPVVSPPHKTQRSVFAHKQQDSQSKSTTR